MFFRGRGIQDGHLSVTFIRNPYGSITLYWIEISTSNFLKYIPEVTPTKLKVPKITEKYQKLPEITENGRKQPTLVHNFVLD